MSEEPEQMNENNTNLGLLEEIEKAVGDMIERNLISRDFVNEIYSHYGRNTFKTPLLQFLFMEKVNDLVKQNIDITDDVINKIEKEISTKYSNLK